MYKRTYDYLNEGNISIDAPTEILERIEKNLEETPNNNLSTLGTIKINQRGSNLEIEKDNFHPYLWTRKNMSKDYEGVDFMRYGSHVQTIWKRNPRDYEVTTNCGIDWNGALNCFKKIYYDTELSKKKTLIHGALTKIRGKGILMVGGCRSGKSTLLMSLLDSLGGVFITEGNTLVEKRNEDLIGHYLPRDVYIRFSSIVDSKRLYSSMEDICSCEATQPIDMDAINKIIKAKAFHVDAGLNYSRERFVNLMGITKSSKSQIDRIIFIDYANGCPLLIKNLSTDEALKKMKRREFPKNTRLGKIQHQSEIQPPQKSLIEENWFANSTPLSLSYNRSSDLTKTVLEDLLL